MTAFVKHPRRYALLLSFDAAKRMEFGLASLARGARAPGTPLSVSCPFLTQLTAVGYTCREDVVGADAAELTRNVGLNRWDAQSVIDSVGS